MINSPLVSVLMPVYNAECYVAQAIESILAQTFQDFEFVILNDGSMDNSLAVLETYAQQDDRVRLINRENRGIVATRNQLLDKCRGQYCAWLDADDIALPERLSRQVEYMNQHPDCVVVGSRLLLIDSDGEPICEFLDLLTHEQIVDCLLGCNMPIFQPSVMMRREAIAKIGGYDEAYPSAEDMDLFLRLAEYGQLVNLPEVLTKYRQHLSSDGYRQRSRQIRCAEAAVNSARRRLGLPPLGWNSAEEMYQASIAKTADHYRKWSWWALGGGNVRTARKYAIASVRQQPFSLESWRAMYCSLRGY